MATNYTTLLGFALPTTGELSGTWGNVVNTSITELVEDAIAGTVTADVTSGNWTLTTTGSGSANEARSAILIPTGTPGVSRNIIAPGSSKAYIVDNQSNAAVVVKASATTGCTINAGRSALVAWDGSDFVLISDDLSAPPPIGNVTPNTGAFTTVTATTGNITTVNATTTNATTANVTTANATTVDTTNLEVTNLKAKDGTAAGSIADSTGVVTIASSVLTTTDINGGTIDGVTVGGASAGAGTFTNLTANTDLTINSTTTVDGVIDDDTMATASATKLATSESIKAYVDSQIGANNDLSEILANGNTSGANDLVIDNGQVLTTNTINETTAGSGVTVDSVLLKDDSVNATSVEVTNIKANDGTAAATVANSTGVVSLSANPVLSGGTANGVIYLDGSKVATSGTALTFDGTNLGIGTSSPVGKLDTLGASYIGSDSNNALFIDSASTLVTIGAAGRTSFSTSSLRFLTSDGIAALERLRIDSSGNVGIGTGSPSAKLHVSGDAYFGNGTALGGVGYSSTDVYFANLVTGGSLTWYTNGAERARIDSSGNVGIGTSSPSAKLDVVSTSTTAAKITTSGVSVGAQLAFKNDYSDTWSIGVPSDNSSDFLIYESGSSPQGNIRLFTNGTERLRIDASGNVGIGTSSPTDLLQIASNTNTAKGIRVLNTNAGLATYASIYFGGATSATDSVIAGLGDNTTAYGGSRSMVLGTNQSTPVVLITGGTERARINSSGNVGIGTSSPGAKLAVNGSITESTDGTNYYNVVTQQDIGTDPNQVPLNQYLGDLAYQDAENIAGDVGVGGDLSLESGTANGVLYLNGSKVATSGSALTFDGSTLKATVSGNSAISANNVTSELLFQSVGNDGYINMTGTGGVIFRLGSGFTERLRIDSSGNVGIGTSSPSEAIEISRDANPKIRFLDVGNIDAKIGIVGSTALGFEVNGSERLRIDSSGNVGIGTSSPSASAILDAQSTTKGVRMPNMTTAQKNAIASPAAGLMVFDTTLSKLCVYTGVAWETVTSI